MTSPTRIALLGCILLTVPPAAGQDEDVPVAVPVEEPEAPAAIPVAEPPVLPPVEPNFGDAVISESKQFRVRGGPGAARGSVAILADQVRAEFLQLIGEADAKYKIPVNIQLVGNPGDPAPPRTIATAIHIGEQGYEIRISIHTGRGLDVGAFQHAASPPSPASTASHSSSTTRSSSPHAPSPSPFPTPPAPSSADRPPPSRSSTTTPHRVHHAAAVRRGLCGFFLLPHRCRQQPHGNQLSVVHQHGGGGGSGTGHVTVLNADGTRDTAFTSLATSTVTAAAVQPDGKILLGGTFTYPKFLKLSRKPSMAFLSITSPPKMSSSSARNSSPAPPGGHSASIKSCATAA